MNWDRKNYLTKAIEHRFSGISAKDAREAHVAGYPYGIAGLSSNAEEREFVERYAGVVLQRLLMRAGH